MARVVETYRRSIAKALSWRVVATLITSLIVWLTTGKFDLAVKVGLFDTFLKFAAYFVHERLWARINFGRRRYSDYQI